MNFRAATIDAIQQIQIVRNSVTENTLSDLNLVTDEDGIEFITVRGKGVLVSRFFEVKVESRCHSFSRGAKRVFNSKSSEAELLALNNTPLHCNG